ncbi:MAG: bifunctional folylpolyglutamate synthase/dihydrofolate synthase [Clostridia bacterium]|nr:bifunctional folylpolyglutamate synthase/dihydrofolate synthase [Clostridia bacterium]
MNYKEAVDFIEAVSWKGSVPGLSRISELCRLLGNPERKVKYVHISGTNGKGSVSAVISSVLTAAGYKTGLYTSPHLVNYTERFKINGCDVSDDEFCRCVSKVKEKAVTMDDAPTEFELLTAAAFVCFADNGCDVAVLECGMGGRLDATNVIPSPLVSVITNVALDHTSVLGDTELKIAHEKAGIIKNAPVVIGKVSKEVESYLLGVIGEKKLTCSLYYNANVENVSSDKSGISFDYHGIKMTLPLRGEYQKINLKTAISAVELLKDQGLDISDGDIERGIASVRWIGRFEKLCGSPEIYFDGAHNPDGAIYTVETFKHLFPGRKAVVVTGVMADKNYSEIARMISGIANVVFCVEPANPRALGAPRLAEIYSDLGVSAFACDSVEHGVTSAAEVAERESLPVLCVGSLYMYSDVYYAVKKISDKEGGADEKNEN